MTAVTKRTGAVLGLVALIVAFLVPAFQSPTAVAASPYYVGQGYEYSDASGGHWFGAQKGPYPDDGLSWCVFLGPNALIPSDANSVTINTLANTDGLVKTGRDEYEFTNVAQAA